MSNPPSSKLSEMQLWIVEQLQQTRALDRTPTVIEQSNNYLTGNERLLPVEQLAIYRQQFWLRHTSSLIEDFPGVSGVLGQDEWEKLVESYLGAHPPDSWTLRNLGEHLAEHIAQRPQTPHQAVCEDMARLEWAYTELFDAADCSPLDQAKLATIPEEAWASAQIILNPALILLNVRYPVAELRRKLRASIEQPNSESIPIPSAEEQCLVLYRNTQRSLYNKQVPPPAFALLQSLKAGQSLVRACEAVASRSETFARDIEQNVGAWFQDWGARGFIIDVTT